MAKFTPKNLNSGFADTDSLNENFSSLETLSDTWLSRDGTSPNTMLADLDMNSNRIINLPDATNSAEPATYGQLLGIGSGNTFIAKVTENITATAGQTVFTLSTISMNPGVDSTDLYINGIYINPALYTINSSTQFTLNTDEAAQAGDVVTAVVNQRAASGDTVLATNVTYSPPGAGSVDTNVEAELQKRVYLSNYSTLTQAITAASSLNLPLYIDENKSYSGDITLPAGITIEGAGMNEVTLTGDGVLNGVNNSNISLSGFAVSSSDVECIFLGGDSIPNTQTDLSVKNVKCSGSTRSGLRIFFADRVAVEGCDLGSCTTAPTDARDAPLSLATIKNLKVHGNYIHDSDQHGISSLGEHTNWSIKWNWVYEIKKQGMNLKPSGSPLLNHNVDVEYNVIQYIGVDENGTLTNTEDGGSGYPVGSNGIFTNGTIDGVVCHNYILDVGEHGVEGTWNAIEDNYIETTGLLRDLGIGSNPSFEAIAPYLTKSVKRNTLIDAKGGIKVVTASTSFASIECCDNEMEIQTNNVGIDYQWTDTAPNIHKFVVEGNRIYPESAGTVTVGIQCNVPTNAFRNLDTENLIVSTGGNDITATTAISGNMTGNYTVQPTPENTFTQFSGGETLSYHKTRDGIVHVQGTLDDGAVSTAFLTLPEGYQPSNTLRRLFDSNSGTAAFVSVNNSGQCIPTSGTYGSGNAQAFSISFKAER